MKIISFNIVVVALLTSLFVRCSDPLDVAPDGRMTLDAVFENPDLTESYFNSLFEEIRKYGPNYSYYTFLTAYTDDGTDSQVPTDTWLPLHQWNLGNVSASNPPLMIGDRTLRYNDYNMWSINYQGIHKCNVFLERANQTNIPIATNYGRYVAEARVLRAHYYFDLIKFWGGVPIIDKDIVKETDFTYIRRASFQECVDFIVEDCDAAIAEPNLPFRTASEKEQGRMTKAVAHFIKASALLFNASPLWNKEKDITKWQVAANAARVAVEELEKNDYALFSNYEQFFITRPDKTPIGSTPTDRETILEAIDTWGYQGQTYRKLGSIAFLMHMIPSFPSEKTGNSPSQELVDSYEMKDGTIPILGYEDEDHLIPIINNESGYDDQQPYLNRDPRFYATIWYNGAEFGRIYGVRTYIESYIGGRHGMSGVKQRSPTGYYTRKYIDPSMRNNGSNTTLWRIYRLGELYLTLAEAENEANGPTPIAYQAVGKVRTRAGIPNFPAGLSKDEFRERIRRERRVEMAIEENRFFDIRRWDIMSENSKVKTAMRWIKNADASLSNERVVILRPNNHDKKYNLFPIYQDEMLRMPLMEQNPGW